MTNTIALDTAAGASDVVKSLRGVDENDALKDFPIAQVFPFIDPKTSPFYYGAVANGSANDAPAWQACFNYCCANGKSMYVGGTSGGAWRLTDPIERSVALPSGVEAIKIYGDARHQTLVYFTGAAGEYALDLDMRDGSSEDAILLRDFSIHRISGATDAGGIRVRNATRSLLSSLYVYGFSDGIGLKLNVDTNGVTADFNSLEDIFIGGCGTGLEIDCSAASSAYLTATYIRNSQFSQNADFDVRIRETGALVGTVQLSDSWVQANAGSAGISIEDGVSSMSLSNVSIDGQGSGHTCLSLAAGVTLARLTNITVDGEISDLSTDAKFRAVRANGAWLADK